MNERNDLATVVPPERQLTLAGTAYTVRPVTLGQLPAVIAALRPLADTGALKDMADASAAGTALVAALLAHPDTLLVALSAASGVPREVLDPLDLAAAADLLSAVIELNADFFVSAVAPRLGGLLAAAASAATN